MIRQMEQENLRTLIAETITLLCKNGLRFQSEFCIEGLLGITLDKDQIFLINIKETVKSALDNLQQSNNLSSSPPPFTSPDTSHLNKNDNHYVDSASNDDSDEYSSASSRRRHRRKRKKLSGAETTPPQSKKALTNASTCNSSEVTIKKELKSPLSVKEELLHNSPTNNISLRSNSNKKDSKTILFKKLCKPVGSSSVSSILSTLPLGSANKNCNSNVNSESTDAAKAEVLKHNVKTPQNINDSGESVDGPILEMPDRETCRIGKDQFRCSYCSRTYVSYKNVQRHIQEAHQGRRFHCKLCQATYTQQPHVKKHLMVIHNVHETQIGKCITTSNTPIGKEPPKVHPRRSRRAPRFSYKKSMRTRYRRDSDDDDDSPGRVVGSVSLRPIRKPKWHPSGADKESMDEDEDSESAEVDDENDDNSYEDDNDEVLPVDEVDLGHETPLNKSSDSKFQVGEARQAMFYNPPPEESGTVFVSPHARKTTLSSITASTAPETRLAESTTATSLAGDVADEGIEDSLVSPDPLFVISRYKAAKERMRQLEEQLMLNGDIDFFSPSSTFEDPFI